MTRSRACVWVGRARRRLQMRLAMPPPLLLLLLLPMLPLTLSPFPSGGEVVEEREVGEEKQSEEQKEEEEEQKEEEEHSSKSNRIEQYFSSWEIMSPIAVAAAVPTAGRTGGADATPLLCIAAVVVVLDGGASSG